MYNKRVNGLTIDSASTLLMDDAIFATGTEKHFQVDITITDVSAHPKIQIGSELDLIAYKKGFTRYGKGKYDPLFPKEIEPDISLLPNVDRAGFTTSFTIANGKCSPPTFTLTTVRSLKKFSYQEADEIINGKKKDGLQSTLLLLKNAAEIFAEERKQDGSLVFYDLDQGIFLDDDGIIRILPPEQRNAATFIVAECMVKANLAMAHYMHHHLAYGIFRNLDHADNTQSRIFTFLNNHFDHSSNADKTKPDANVANGRAYYSAHAKPHPLMGNRYYTKGTSPGRAYPDLLTQRVMKWHLMKKRQPYHVTNMEQMTKHLTDIERSISEY